MNPFLDAGMDAFVEDNDIVAPGKRAEQSKVGDRAAAQKERPFGTEKPAPRNFQNHACIG